MKPIFLFLICVFFILQVFAETNDNEIVVEVRAKKNLIGKSTSTSSNEIKKDQIEALPQGDSISLPKLLTSTTPGVVSGPFGQMFFRGSHANIQYQIDGVQMPDSLSNTFGDSISPRNIDHMEVITGGIPAEFGERLAAVVNIVTKSGPETPGGSLNWNIGSYNTSSPSLVYGGSDASGTWHYFFSATYNQTDRGIDTPQPATETNQSRGGTDAIHDHAFGDNAFLKIDWLKDNSDKFTFIGSFSYINNQIPNYPSSFKSTDAFFSAGYSDQFGNSGGANPTFNFTPYNTNDWQAETDSYLQSIWKHSFSSQEFLQTAIYAKLSNMHVQNDLSNDLATGTSVGSTPITGSVPSSFYEDRQVSNYGLKVDYTLIPSSEHFVKAGVQGQYSLATGPVSVFQDPSNGSNFSDNATDQGGFEGIYVQDDWTLSKKITLNLGLRFDATQFSFPSNYATASLLQPRLGMSYLLSETTKLHVFYGKLFQPAPLENLRDAFVITQALPANTTYNIQPELDDYYEIGIAQQFAEQQVWFINLYYKSAQNMLDDAQLLNTAIAQPYNYATGFAYGAELSIKGDLNPNWSEYFNYAYEIAMGQGVSGGIWVFPVGQAPGSNYQYLDHVQVHTANAGLVYRLEHFSWTNQFNFGSGLRTGISNSNALPAHATADSSITYSFAKASTLNKWKVSGDILNLTNNAYPITISNGFNGSHYAAGTEYFLRLSREL